MSSLLQQAYTLFNNNPHENGLKAFAKSDIMNIGNQLTGILSDRKVNIDPPQLVVVGLQSAGKTSVINRIIEMDILPVNKNMCTRTPLNLQLICSDKNMAEFGDYVEGIWKISKKYPLNELIGIREEIEKQTIAKAGSGQAISHNPIILKIFAPNLPNLSLIDLPGLTSVACIDKGQPKDIKEQIKKLIGSYIKTDRSIILLIMAARSDLEVDPAFELAKEYDPDGHRTIGVLTKVDLMNTDSDINNYLTNEGISQSLRLKHGYYALKNKGSDQKEVSISAKQIADNEITYFKTNPIYAKDASLSHCGIYNLVDCLTDTLTEHIRNSLPALYNEICQLEAGINQSLLELGQKIPDKENYQSSWVHMLVSNFCRSLLSALEDRGGPLNYGRRVKDILKAFRREISQITYNPNDELIADALSNCDGNHMLSIPSIEVIEYCLKSKGYIHGPIHNMYQPSINCLEAINQLIIDLIDELLKNSMFTRFPNLMSAIKKEIVGCILNPKNQHCVTQIKNIIDIEENYIWTEEPQFSDQLHKLYATMKPGSINYAAMRTLINSYFDTVKKSISDRVPKEIMLHYIRCMENDISETLFDKLTRSPVPIAKLLEEPPHIAEKRRKLNEQKAQITNVKSLFTNLINK